MLVYLIFLNIIILSIGMYFKIQNDKSSISDDDFKYHKYLNLKYDHPNIYFYLINRYAKRLVRNKKIKSYQRKLLKEFVISSGYCNELNSKLLEDDRILAMQFDQELYLPLMKKIKMKLIKKKNNKKEVNNMYDPIFDSIPIRSESRDLTSNNVFFNNKDNHKSKDKKRRGDAYRNTCKLLRLLNRCKL